MMRQGRIAARVSTVLQARAISNNTGIWSENTDCVTDLKVTNRQTKKIEQDQVCVRVPVWGQDTDCTRLKESMRHKKSFTIGLSGQLHVNIKIPNNKNMVIFRHNVCQKKQKTHLIKSLLYLGGPINYCTQHF